MVHVEEDDVSVSSMEILRRKRQREMEKAEKDSVTVMTVRNQCEEEWNDYMNVGDLDEDKCPLQWWRDNAEKYERLSILARRFLAVQATSAASERVFSAAALIISNKRTSLKSEMAGQLLYISQNIDWYEDQLKERYGA